MASSHFIYKIIRFKSDTNHYINALRELYISILMLEAKQNAFVH